jgi:hypothetical protein
VLPDPRPDKLPFQGFSETKPAWLDIEFTLAVNVQGGIAPSSSNLYALLKPQYFLSEMQLLYQEAWKEGDDLKEIAKKPIYYFLIQIPEALNGTTICAQAILNPPPFGEHVLDRYGAPLSKTKACAGIVAPCSKADTSRVVESQIKFSRYSGNFSRAVQLADSSLDAGWRIGLQDALTSAQRSMNHEAALRFLDLLYETKGTVVSRPGGTLGSAEEEKRAYRERREIILRQIAEQAQQQR